MDSSKSSFYCPSFPGVPLQRPPPYGFPPPSTGPHPPPNRAHLPAPLPAPLPCQLPSCTGSPPARAGWLAFGFGWLAFYAFGWISA